LTDYLIKGWKVEVNIKQKENLDFLLKDDPTESISFVTGIIFSLLISKEYPHNLIFTDKGTTCYILARKFTDKKIGMTTSWLDVSGYPTIYDDELLKKVKENGPEVISKLLKEEISLDEEAFNQISSELTEMFVKKYKTI
jgi:hypothetical protein